MIRFEGLRLVIDLGEIADAALFLVAPVVCLTLAIAAPIHRAGYWQAFIGESQES